MNKIKIATSKDMKPVTKGDKLLKDMVDQMREGWVEPDLCPECDSMTHLEVEQREGGYQEIVRYCHYCGCTQTS